MTHNKKSIIHDTNMEIVINSDEYHKYIEYFKDLINSPPPSFIEIC
jgi:hypothetical protein